MAKLLEIEFDDTADCWHFKYTVNGQVENQGTFSWQQMLDEAATLTLIHLGGDKYRGRSRDRDDGDDKREREE